MDDKEFLKYFEILSSRPANAEAKVKVVSAVDHIVMTLQAVSHSKAQSATTFVSTLGEKVVEDIDYSIKRCVRSSGQSTETHVQIHYALALKEILSKLGSSINVQALVDYILEMVSKKHAISKSEVKHFGMGRLALFKAIIQSQIIEKHSQDPEHLYTFIFELLEQEMATYPENVLDVCEDIFKQKLHQKLKAKLFFQHILKNQLKHHSGVATRALIIGHFAHKHNNNASFAQQSYLDDKITNTKNFKAVLNDIKQSYPQEHTAVKSIVQYLRGIYTKPAQWIEFWKNLLREFCMDVKPEDAEETKQTTSDETNSKTNSPNYRNYFVVLALFRRYIKEKSFSASDFKCIQVEELLHLWLKHFTVRNDTMKAFSMKVQKSLLKQLAAIQSKDGQAISAEDRRSVMEVVYLLRSKTTLKFTPKLALPKALFSFMNEQESAEYLIFVKKQLHKSMGFMGEYMFYLNELYVFADYQFQHNSKKFEGEFYEICFILFENSQTAKLTQVYNKQNSETKQEITLKDFIRKYADQIQSLYNSLLSSTLKLASANFKDHKSYIWRGLNSKNELWIFNVLKFIVKKSASLSADQELTDTIKELQEYITLAESMENEIKTSLASKAEEDKTGYSNKKKRSLCNLLVGVCLMSLFYSEEGLSNLEELKQIHESVEAFYDEKLKAENPKKKIKLSATVQGKPTDDSEDVPFIRVLSDLLVSLLTKSVHYMREIANLCFQTFVHEVDQFSLQTLIDVITRSTEEYVGDMPNEDDEEGDWQEEEANDDEE